MRITTKQRRLLIEIAGRERLEAAVRRKDGGVTIEAANTAGSVTFAAGVPEGSVVSALKRLEARGLVEKLPRDYPGDSPLFHLGHTLAADMAAFASPVLRLQFPT